jgi:hypothetical protein
VLPLLPLPSLSLLSKLDRTFFSPATNPAPDLAPATGLVAEAAGVATALALVSPVMSAAKDTMAPRSSTPCTHAKQQQRQQPQRRDAA